MPTFKWTINEIGSFTWNAPSDITGNQVTVELWGGGGAGGNDNVNGGGGGGGAAYSKKVVTITPSTAYTVVTGAGGSITAGAGNAGADSTFNSTDVVAKGGGGGGVGSGLGQGAGGAAGTAAASTGDTKFSGGAGGGGAAVQVNGGGGGGSAGSNGAGGAGSSNRAAGLSGDPDGGTGGVGGATATIEDGAVGSYPGSGGGGAAATTQPAVGVGGKAILTWSTPDDTATTSDSFSRTVNFNREIGNLVPDESGNDRHGTASGTVKPAVVDTPFSGFGKAFFFDGVDLNDNSCGVNCGATGLGATTAMGGFTLELKFRRDRQGVSEILAGKWGSSASEDNHVLLLDGADNKLKFFMLNSADTAITSVSNSALSNGNYTVAAVWNGTRIYLYIDGHEQSSRPTISAIKAPDATTPFWIGRWKNLAAAGDPFPFQGVIDEVRMSNIARYTDLVDYTPATTPFTTDANTLGLWHLDNVSEQVTVSDATSFIVGYFRSTADSVTPVDAISKGPGKVLADSVTSSDEITGKVIGLNKSDTATAVDALSRTVSYIRSISDTATATDVISKGISLTFADTIGAGGTTIKKPIYLFDD